MSTCAGSDWPAYFQAAEQLFRDGQFSALWASVQRVEEAAIPEERRPRYYFYILTCALYGIGDLQQAKALNRRLDFRFHPTIRYRLCLRLGDYLAARRLRHAHPYSDSERADFRYTLGLHCLSKGKYRSGLHFYQERHRAINTPQSLMAPLQYHYLTDDPGDDPDVVVLEQGMGEVLISLLHIKAAQLHSRSRFCGMPKYRRLVARYFPQASYHSTLNAAEFAGQKAILALDFLKRAWHQQGSFAPAVLFDSPLRGRHSKPVFGICWRGGSAQNRREERHIPLQYFVEFLPKQYDYWVLQYDVSEQERQFLRGQPHIQVPLLDLTADALATFDLVRELTGVISVAGANWHLAGGANIPLLAIMHDSSHWLWGKPADARSVYPCATTLAKQSLSLAQVEAWCQRALNAWQERAPALLAPSGAPGDRPIFVTGLPGAALAQVMHTLIEQGVWSGVTPAQNPPPNAEAYENPLIRQRLLGNILKKLGGNELCTLLPPGPERLPPFPWLRFQLERALREQGWDGAATWALQDFSLALLWPLLARAYPEATWLVVTQDTERVAAHLLTQARFAEHSSSLEYWKMYVQAFNERLATLCASDERVLLLDGEQDAAALSAQLASRLNNRAG